LYVNRIQSTSRLKLEVCIEEDEQEQDLKENGEHLNENLRTFDRKMGNIWMKILKENGEYLKENWEYLKENGEDLKEYLGILERIFGNIRKKMGEIWKRMGKILKKWRRFVPI